MTTLFEVAEVAAPDDNKQSMQDFIDLLHCNRNMSGSLKFIIYS